MVSNWRKELAHLHCGEYLPFVLEADIGILGFAVRALGTCSISCSELISANDGTAELLGSPSTSDS